MRSPVAPTNRTLATWGCDRDDTLWPDRCEQVTSIKAETVNIVPGGMGHGTVPSSETFRCQLDADHEPPHEHGEPGVVGISGPWRIEWEDET